MTPFIQQFFELKANTALKQSLDRACDLSHFKQVKTRLDAGEDLTKELPQLKKLSKNTLQNTILGHPRLLLKVEEKKEEKNGKKSLGMRG